MDYLLIGLRLVHIVSAALWVGMIFFTVFFLTPAVQEVGPDGGKVMAALQRRGLLNFVPTLAVLTIVSGLWLYWRTSLGLNPAYVHSATGGTLALGGLATMAAFVVGLTRMRRSMLRVLEISQSLGGVADENERQRLMGEMQRLRGRARTGGRIVVTLLLFATVTMSVARYL
jgi:uncharacterized membrane protein